MTDYYHVKFTKVNEVMKRFGNFEWCLEKKKKGFSEEGNLNKLW